MELVVIVVAPILLAQLAATIAAATGSRRRAARVLMAELGAVFSVYVLAQMLSAASESVTEGVDWGEFALVLFVAGFAIVAAVPMVVAILRISWLWLRRRHALHATSTVDVQRSSASPRHQDGESPARMTEV